MKNKIIFPGLLLLLSSCAHKFEHADLVVHNARIYTLDETNTIAQAMAIVDGKIIETGSEYEIRNKYHADEEYDAMQRVIVPGFIDAHCHLVNFGMGLQQVQLYGCKSLQEINERVLAFRRKNPGLPYIIGRGWNQELFMDGARPENTLLNAAVSDIPVYLIRVDGHAALINQPMIALAGISPTSTIEGGTFEKLSSGKLSGVIVDNAMERVRSHLPEYTDKQIEKALMEAQPHFLAYGLTTLADAGSEARIFQIIHRLQQAGRFKPRVYGMLVPDSNAISMYASHGIFNDDRLHIGAFKVVADGALGSRGACLKEEYSDMPGHYGKLIFTPLQLDSLFDVISRYDYQVNTHCIGDSANKTVLSLYARYLEGPNDRRWRIEHAQVMSPEDFHYFTEYSIIPSVQPTHAVSDMPMALHRVGAERLKGAYAFRTLYELNHMIALGTDFPVEEVDPFKTFYAVVTRCNYEGKELEGLSAGDTLTRLQALRAMTLFNAMACFEEQKKGTLEKGKLADFIILDHDILKVPAKKILETHVMATFINGKRAYSLE